MIYYNVNFWYNMPITGNTGKIHVIEKIKELSSSGKKLTILDAGCGDLNLWVDSGIDLTNVTVHGFDRSEKALEKAKENAKKISKDCFNFYNSTVDNFPSLFDFKFDLVVSTNVLEHLRNVPSFFSNIRKVVSDNSIGLFVCDSAHFQSRKRFSKKSIDSIYKIKRQYVDDFFLKPLSDKDIQSSLQKSKFELVLLEYYCIDPVKFIHNHIVDSIDKDTIMDKWYGLEKLLNQNEKIKNEFREFCSSIYFETKPI